MTTGATPYETPVPSDSDDSGAGSPLEFTLHAEHRAVDIGDGHGETTMAEVFNRQIPGPTIKLLVNQTVIIRLINDLDHPTGIHWHGIELMNYGDGTEVTQDGAPPRQIQQLLGNGVRAGGTFLYKFKVTRPGIYWYHPHHHNSMNRVFRGMYGMIVVTDPAESSIVSPLGTTDRQLPSTEDTLQVVLSDITVSRPPNDLMYNDPTAEWVSGVTAQTGPSKHDLCDGTAVGGRATDDNGNLQAASYGPGEIPSVVRPQTPGTPNNVEGNIVLTNGMNVGGRLGTPASPGDRVTTTATGTPTPLPKDVLSGGGLRLQMVNCCTMRYFRLRITYRDNLGVTQQLRIIRIGGEGGLLDRAILEGGNMGTFATDHDPGELLLPPATRADVVIAIPAGLNPDTLLTMWTRDFKRIGSPGRNNYPQLPTVPVMHLRVSGPKAGTPYTITGQDINSTTPTGTALRAPAGMSPVENFALLTPGALLAGPAEPGGTFARSNIKLTADGVAPKFDSVDASLMPAGSAYTSSPHIPSSRYAAPGSVLELRVTNTTNAHHPFHLHGFSFQPISLGPETGGTQEFTWTSTAVGPQRGYRELRDTIDIPPHRQLTFRVRLDPRKLLDGTTDGGEFGRWLFHCHIFFHHERGMISELVVTDSSLREKPNINVGGSWAYTSNPGSTSRDGTYHHPSGRNVVSIVPTLEDGVTTIGAITRRTGTTSGTWHWEYPASGADRTVYVYVTATDDLGKKDQCFFRLQIGGADAGSDQGDPHIHTVDGKRYDFQSAGEFVLLRDREGMEIQTRQTPVETPPPITDSYSGLTACVSLNTAMAAWVGAHRISYQAFENRFRLFLDGKPTAIPDDGLDLGAHRVSTFDTGTPNRGLRIDYGHGAIVTATPLLWGSYGIWYLDISVTNTCGTEGIMGRIPKSTWLPLLPGSVSVGPKPESLRDRYVALYQTFANAWRVTDQTSLFWYAPGTSTATFTDVDWPHPPRDAATELVLTHVPREQPPGETVRCRVRPGFATPRKPIPRRIDIEEARKICRNVHGEFHDNCVFDVASTGDASFAEGYLFAQELRRNSTRVQITCDKVESLPGEPIQFTAIVAPLTRGRPTPRGTITFCHHHPLGEPIRVDADGRATFTSNPKKVGPHSFRAIFTPDKPFLASSSPNVVVTVVEPPKGDVGGGPGQDPGTGGTGPKPCPVHGRNDCGEWICRLLRNAARLLHECIEQTARCSGDHPHPDQAVATPTKPPTTQAPPAGEGGASGGGGGGHGH